MPKNLPILIILTLIVALGYTNGFIEVNKTDKEVSVHFINNIKNDVNIK
jgi:hypothetical protein